MAWPAGSVGGLITRFAPSPTGPLHLGHAYSALLTYDMAQAAGGIFHLRIEDTDSTRCKPAFTAQIIDDLAWLGCTWATIRHQSAQTADYDTALAKLTTKGMTFPCDCNRRTILDTGAAQGPDGPVYPGTCIHKTMAHATDAIRLNLTAALKYLPKTITYHDTETGPTSANTRDVIKTIGAPILRRKDTGDTAYHLACTHDDALQNITHVIRGLDVEPLTPIHVILQHLMGWSTPIYNHHALITDDSGKRLAKIDKSKALAKFRAEGATPNDIRRMIGLQASFRP